MAVSRRSGDEFHPWLPNGDLRPEGVVEDFERECLLLNRTADLRRSGREALASIDLKDSFDFNGEVERQGSDPYCEACVTASLPKNLHQ